MPSWLVQDGRRRAEIVLGGGLREVVDLCLLEVGLHLCHSGGACSYGSFVEMTAPPS
jgi:hypothetical protein